jgi:putative DNA primase/helicase
LTVDTGHELAVWLYGPPGGGKSTLIEGLKAMLGKRAGLLGLADVQRSRFALADLPGKTLVVAAEQPSDFIHSTQLINNIVSGEEIPVERKFRDAFTVTPRAKICWAMNDLPRVKDANSGLFRRVKVVAFPKLRDKPDPGVKERIKTEGAGILNWALEGLHRLRERSHFEVPESVRAATAEFRQSNDVPGTFVEEACITSDAPDVEEQAMDLYRAYHHWCRISGHHPLSSTKVAAEWRRLGFGSRSLGGKKFYTGVKVDESWTGAQEDYPKI